MIDEYLNKSNHNLVHYQSCKAVRRILISALAVCLKALVISLRTYDLGLKGPGLVL